MDTNEQHRTSASRPPVGRIVAGAILALAGAVVAVGLTTNDDDPAIVASPFSDAEIADSGSADSNSADSNSADSNSADSNSAGSGTAGGSSTTSPAGPGLREIPLEQSSEGNVADFPSVDLASLEAPPILLDHNIGLTDLDGWLQGSDADFAAVSDRPATVIQFWTFGCYNCTNTLPYLKDVHDTWSDHGVEFIGVHAPEFDFERDEANIAEAAVDLGVTWPIAIDTRRTNFRAWQGGPNYWPRTYVLDREGRIRYDEIGEGGYSRLADTVAWLLANDTETAATGDSI